MVRHRLFLTYTCVFRLSRITFFLWLKETKCMGYLKAKIGDFRNIVFCERFEPMSHFKSRLSLIVRVNVVLNRTVVVGSDWRFDRTTCAVVIFKVKVSCIYDYVSWWYYTLFIDLIGQIRRDVIGRLSVKPWCYWLWGLVSSNWCFSIRLLSQLNRRLLLLIVSSPVVLS